MVMRILSPLLLVTFAMAQTDKASGGKPKLHTVCDILRAPLQYNGQIVRVRDSLDGTDEGTWLKGENCPGVLVTDGHVWPSAIFLQTPNSNPHAHIHPIPFKYDSESERRIKSKYQQLRIRLPDRCIAWTFTGLFETRQNWSEAKITYYNGTSKLVGFGHLGDAPGQLILKSTDDVEPIPNCGNR